MTNTLFFNDGKRKIDYVLVHENDEDPKKIHKENESNKNKNKIRKKFEEFIKREGLELEREEEEEEPEKGGYLCRKIKKLTEKEITEKLFFTKVHVPCKTLLKYAELLKMKMPYEENDLPPKRECSCYEAKRKMYLDINDQLMDEKKCPAFSISRGDLSNKVADEGKSFTNIQRSKICFEILSFNHRSYEGNTKLEHEAKSEDKANTECFDGITTLIDNKTYTAGYSLHEMNDKKHPSSTEDSKMKIDYLLVHEENENNEDKNKIRKKFEEFIKREGLKLERENVEPEEGGYLCRKIKKLTEKETTKKIVFTKVHVPYETLSKYAELLKMKMPNKENDLETEYEPKCSCFEAKRKEYLKIFKLEDDQLMDKKYFTTVFSKSRGDQFVPGVDEGKFFTNSQRSRICFEILSLNHRSDEGNTKLEHEEKSEDEANTECVGITTMLDNKTYTAAYPLHDGQYFTEGNDRQLLYEHWTNPRKWYKYQPLDKIRNYFGEKVGIYFTWLGFYTSMLIPAAIAGVIVFLYGLATMMKDKPSTEICEDPIISKYTMCPMCDKPCSYWHMSDSCTYSRISYLFDNPATVAFAIIMALWASLVNEFWNRKQAAIKYRWDLANFEEIEENVRPQYKVSAEGFKKRKSPRNGKEEPHVPIVRKVIPYATSFSVMFLFIALVIAAVSSVILYRILISSSLLSYPESLIQTRASLISKMFAAGINLVIIFILDKIYQKVAYYLTEKELHRTQRQWEDAFTFKMFLFQFVNFYSSIFYIAFFKGKFVGRPGKYNRSLLDKRQEECDPSGCLIDLCIQLGIVMTGNQIINNFKDILIPKIIELIKSLFKKNKPTRWEQDYSLVDIPELGLFNEYIIMVIQYGFVTIFVAAFPLAPLLALLNNLIEIRADSYKFTTKWRRPVAERVQDMGIWFGILRGISAIALFTNAAIIAFTSEFIPKLVYMYGYSPDQTLSGYTNFSLSEFKVQYFAPQSVPDDPKMEIFGNVTQCRFRGYFEEDSSSPGEYKYTMAFWQILAARLAFIVIFENLVVFCTWLVMYLVPKIPYHVRLQMLQDREALFKHILKEQKNTESTNTQYITKF